MNLGTALWSGLLPRWRGRSGEAEAGYTLLLPVPGDLPVFARLALDVVRRQERQHRVAALVISDLPSPGVRGIVDEAHPEWPDLSYIAPAPYLRPALRALNDPGRFHGVQLVTGVEHARGTHILLHDADAILLDPRFLDGQYRTAVDHDADAVGVHPLWDVALREHRPDLVATWEMCARTSWLRSVAPYRHLAHPIAVGGGQHVADTTVYAQMRSGEGRLVLHGSDADFVHFNYVVSTYRKFQRASGVFEDTDFRLLFVRALTDALDVAAGPSLPDRSSLARGLSSNPDRVVYPDATPTKAAEYDRFRRRFGRAMGLVYRGRADVLDRLAETLLPFDRHYGLSTERGISTDGVSA